MAADGKPRYKRKRTLYQLTFEDPDLEGLEVTTRRVSIEGLKRFAEMFDTAQSLGLDVPGDDKALKPEHLGLIEQLFAAFARVIVEWNLDDDDDEPVPATTEGLLSLDLDFGMKLVESWIAGMVVAPPPLPGSSPSGGNSPEEQTPGLAEASRSLKS